MRVCGQQLLGLHKTLSTYVTLTNRVRYKNCVQNRDVMTVAT
jgi:hypothetical protein